MFQRTNEKSAQLKFTTTKVRIIDIRRGNGSRLQESEHKNHHLGGSSRGSSTAASLDQQPFDEDAPLKVQINQREARRTGLVTQQGSSPFPSGHQ